MENTINMPGGGSLVGAAATTERCEGLVRVDCEQCGETSYHGYGADWTGCPYCSTADPAKRAALAEAQAERRIERCARAVAEVVTDTNRLDGPIVLADPNERGNVLKVVDRLGAYYPEASDPDTFALFRESVSERACELLVDWGAATDKQMHEIA